MSGLESEEAKKVFCFLFRLPNSAISAIISLLVPVLIAKLCHFLQWYHCLFLFWSPNSTISCTVLTAKLCHFLQWYHCLFLFWSPNSAIFCNDIIACFCFDLQTLPFPAMISLLVPVLTAKLCHFLQWYHCLFLFWPPNSAISCNDFIACSCFDLQTQAQSISGKGLRYHDQKVAIKNI